MVCEEEEDNLKRLRRQVDGLAALQANSDLRISGNAESGLWHELMQDRLILVRRLSDASVDRKIRLIGRWYTAGLVGPSQLVESQLLQYPECNVRKLWLEIVGAEPGDLSDAAAEELRWQEELDRQDSSGKREQRTIDDLDQHILKHVLSFIDEEQLAPVRLVSRAFRNACSALLTQVCVSTLPQLKSLTRDFPQLRALEIEVLEPASVKYLNSFVKAVNKNLPRLGHSLETLTLNLSICLSSQSIGDAVASLSNLRQLQLLDAADLEPWVAISLCMPKLASLRLQISDATADTQRLLEQVAPKLDALTLIGFSPSCPPGLFTALPNLQSLCLHSQFSTLPDTLAEAVAGCPSLTSLSLLDTTANIDFAWNLLEALALRRTRQPLQELRLELDEMGHENLAEMTASTWARLQPLSSLSTLSCLRLGTVSRSSAEPYVFFDPGLWSIMPASLRVVHIERSVGGFPEPSHDSLIEELQSGRFRQLAELQGVSLDIPHFRSGIFNEQAMTWEPLTTLTSLGAGLLLLADQPEPLPEAGPAPVEPPLLEQQQPPLQPPPPQQQQQQQEPPPPPPPPDLKEQVALAVGNAFWAGSLIRTMAPQLQELSLTLPTIADLGVQVQDVLSALLRPLEGLAQLHSLSLDIWPPQEDQADAPPAEGEPREEPLALKNLVPLLDRLATWPQLRRLRLESVAGGDMAGPYVSLKRKHLGLPYCHVVSSNGYDSDYSNDDD